MSADDVENPRDRTSLEPESRSMLADRSSLHVDSINGAADNTACEQNSPESSTPCLDERLGDIVCVGEKKDRYLKHKCLLSAFVICVFLFLLCTTVVLSMMLYFEKKDSNLLMNELFVKSKQLECYMRNSEADVCPQAFSPLLKCRRVVTINCDALVISK